MCEIELPSNHELALKLKELILKGNQYINKEHNSEEEECFIRGNFEMDADKIIRLTLISLKKSTYTEVYTKIQRVKLMNRLLEQLTGETVKLIGI